MNNTPVLNATEHTEFTGLSAHLSRQRTDPWFKQQASELFYAFTAKYDQNDRPTAFLEYIAVHLFPENSFKIEKL